MGRNTIVLVKRGADADGNDLTFVDKVNNLSGLSPYAVVIYDDRDELLTSFAIDSDDTTAVINHEGCWRKAAGCHRQAHHESGRPDHGAGHRVPDERFLQLGPHH